MPRTLYYFRPSKVADVVKKLSSRYPVVPLDRAGKDHTPWHCPAVFIADSRESDFRLLEARAPAHGLWRMGCLVGGAGPARACGGHGGEAFGLVARRSSLVPVYKCE